MEQSNTTRLVAVARITRQLEHLKDTLNSAMPAACQLSTEQLAAELVAGGESPNCEERAPWASAMNALNEAYLQLNELFPVLADALDAEQLAERV